MYDVCTPVCVMLYVYAHIHMHACMSLCMHVRTNVTYACRHAYTYVRMYVGTHACMHVRAYVCVSVYMSALHCMVSEPMLWLGWYVCLLQIVAAFPDARTRTISEKSRFTGLWYASQILGASPLGSGFKPTCESLSAMLSHLPSTWCVWSRRQSSMWWGFGFEFSRFGNWSSVCIGETISTPWVRSRWIARHSSRWKWISINKHSESLHSFVQHVPWCDATRSVCSLNVVDKGFSHQQMLCASMIERISITWHEALECVISFLDMAFCVHSPWYHHHLLSRMTMNRNTPHDHIGTDLDSLHGKATIRFFDLRLIRVTRYIQDLKCTQSLWAWTTKEHAVVYTKSRVFFITL